VAETTLVPHYLKCGDWEEDAGLLWDGVKECGIKDSLDY
jgi:hypothetical protein